MFPFYNLFKYAKSVQYILQGRNLSKDALEIHKAYVVILCIDIV
jgi:hypothetical protein